MGKKVKVSKNRKKNWRKHVNIDDVEDFLEHKRFEERTGFDSSAPDDRLFIVDTEPSPEDDDENNDDEGVEKTTIETVENEKPKSSKLKQLIENHRFYKKLENQSKIVSIKTQKVTKITQRTKYNDDDKLVKYWTDSKDQIVEAKKKKAEENKKKSVIGANETDFTRDLWGAEDLSDDANEWLPEQPVLKVPAHRYQKNSFLPSVEVPPNATSYNPDQEEHKNALNTEAYRIMKMERKENLYKPVLLNKQQALEQEKSYLEEMCQGLPGLDKNWENEADNDDDDDDDNGNDNKQNGDDEEDDDDDDEKMKKLPKATTRKQKLRKKLEQMYIREIKLLKNKKLSENKINQIKRYKRELQEMDKKSALKSLQKKQMKLSAMYRPAKLSRNRYVEPDLPLTLPSEVNDSFRKIKVGGNLLEDRFKSFQRRNIIETRVPQFNKRKFKLKKEVKRRHRPAVTDV